MSENSNVSFFQPGEYPTRGTLVALARLRHLVRRSVENENDPEARLALAKSALLENVGRNQLTPDETIATVVLLRLLQRKDLT